ncbi:MAG: cytidine deaminase [Clostridia bacterium]|nr:cytidine deaminase [Clostridia bacterium]
MNRIDLEEMEKMLDLAEEAMHHAYTPYSNFQVGACLRTSDGEYYLGCNIENASYTPTVCAERTAMFKAVFDGKRSFDGIAIICSGNNPSFPCGVCRQVLSEFCEPGMPVLSSNRNREYTVCTLGELLPHSFGIGDLKA